MLVLEFLVGLHRMIQLQLFQHYWLGHNFITVILSGLPWKWTEIILLFLRLNASTAFQTVDYDGYSISSKGSLPIVRLFELNSSIPVHFSSLTPKRLWFTLAISCLITYNLPWLQFSFYCAYSPISKTVSKSHTHFFFFWLYLTAFNLFTFKVLSISMFLLPFW